MKFNDIRSTYIGTFYLFILSYMTSTQAISTPPQQTKRPEIRNAHLVGIRANSMKITNGTSTVLTLIIERAPVPNQLKEYEYGVINNLQPQATYTLDYEYVADSDKKQQQVTGILIFSGEVKDLPLSKVAKSKLPAGSIRIGIPLKANYILKTSGTTYELYAQASQQTSPSHHRYFKVEQVSDNTYNISKEIVLFTQAVSAP